VSPNICDCDQCGITCELGFDGVEIDQTGDVICDTCMSAMTDAMDDEHYRNGDWSDFDDDDENADSDFWVD